MHPTFRGACAVLLLAALAPATRPAQAETYQTCAGFIDSLPATITTQGVWCLRKDLSTAMAVGAAINIATNNVTIDCNDFKLGGLAAGDGTRTMGIHATSRENATIRNCNIRGFMSGVRLLNGSGHAVLDSRFDNNTHVGIYLYGDGSLIRGNRIMDTGGSTVSTSAYGILYGQSVAGNVVDNVVQGVYASGSMGQVFGISAALSAGEVARNSISVLQSDSNFFARGIQVPVDGSRVVIRDNTISMPTTAPVYGIGIDCFDAIVRDNTVSGLTYGQLNCTDAGGNFSN